MRLYARMIMTAVLLTGCTALAGCGKKDQTSSTVQMNNMEVVDGTATDAMTDLDGVQSETAPSALPANRSDNGADAAPSTAPKNEAAGKPGADTEILSDQ